MTDEQSTTAEEPPVVVKIGGAKAVDPAGAVGDVAHLAANGRRVVVVHGGSTVVDEVIERLGMEPSTSSPPPASPVDSPTRRRWRRSRWRWRASSTPN